MKESLELIFGFVSREPAFFVVALRIFGSGDDAENKADHKGLRQN
jgi:hypothetical protein